MANFTEVINDKHELLYNYLYGDTPGKIVLYSNIVLSSLIGPILMFGIVTFEMFGGDSQKRTIVNRLLSALLINAAMLSILVGIRRITRDTVGLLDYNLALFFRISAIFFHIAAGIFYNALTVFRFLFIVVWKRMRGIQDKFWFYLFSFSAYFLSFWFIFWLMITDFPPNDGLLIFLTKENIAIDDRNVTLDNR